MVHGLLYKNRERGYRQKKKATGVDFSTYVPGIPFVYHGTMYYSRAGTSESRVHPKSKHKQQA